MASSAMYKCVNAILVEAYVDGSASRLTSHDSSGKVSMIKICTLLGNSKQVFKRHCKCNL